MGSFRKLLIANRGEIACRVARTARRLGIPVVAVYSEADVQARHVRVADEAVLIGPGPAAQSYLRVDRILEAARRTGADAIHPGYGFLSENASFAQACEQAGITFVGPPAAAIDAMGSKSAAKERMSRAGVPTLPGYHGEQQSVDALEKHAKALGFPLIIKPSGGGGGKGMHIVHEAGELRAAIEGAKRLAAAAFKDDRLLLERYLPAPRHVEVQVFADRHGAIVHLFDRDCSIQRRHQKLMEEAPAPGIDEDVRQRLHSAACTVAREVGYVGAGTIEFLMSGREFFFMEMNTRLQVEHPVTEAITGLDLVEWQLRVAAGEPLPLTQQQIVSRGHAIEVRLCAEDPAKDFVPSAGTLDLMRWPAEGEGIRVDAGFETGDTVPALYDSLLGKIVAHSASRGSATGKLIEAVSNVRVSGVATNASWLVRALRQPDFTSAHLSTAFIARNEAALMQVAERQRFAPFAAAAYAASLVPDGVVKSPWDLADGFRPGFEAAVTVSLLSGEAAGGAGGTSTPSLRMAVAQAAPGVLRVRMARDVVELARVPYPPPLQRWQLLRADDPSSVPSTAIGAGPGPADTSPAGAGKGADVLVASHRITVWLNGEPLTFTPDDGSQFDVAAPASAGSLTTPLPGVVVSVAVKQGDTVMAGQTLLVVEAMKMEHAIKAPHAGRVKSLTLRVGDRVREGSTLAEIE